MPLYLFYTMVQKSQKWPKTQIKGGGPALISVKPLTTENTENRTTVIHFYFSGVQFSVKRKFAVSVRRKFR